MQDTTFILAYISRLVSSQWSRLWLQSYGMFASEVYNWHRNCLPWLHAELLGPINTSGGPWPNQFSDRGPVWPWTGKVENSVATAPQNMFHFYHILPMPLRMKFCSAKPKRRRQHALSALIVPQHWVSKYHRFRMFLWFRMEHFKWWNGCFEDTLTPKLKLITKTCHSGQLWTDWVWWKTQGQELGKLDMVSIIHDAHSWLDVLWNSGLKLSARVQKGRVVLSCICHASSTVLFLQSFWCAKADGSESRL